MNPKHALTLALLLSAGLAFSQAPTEPVERISIPEVSRQDMDSNEEEPNIFTVKPSPTGEGLVVAMPGNFELEVYDEAGKLVSTASPNGSFVLTIKDLPTGKYFLEVVALDGMRGIKEIFVQH